MRRGQRIVAREASHLYGNRVVQVPAGTGGVILEVHGLFRRSVSVRYDNGVELFQPTRKIRTEQSSSQEEPQTRQRTRHVRRRPSHPNRKGLSQSVTHWLQEDVDEQDTPPKDR